MSKSKVLKAGMGYIIGNYLLKGISFITIPLFSRLMSTSEYGLFNTFIAYESIVYIFIGFALHSSFKNARYKFIESDNESTRYDRYVSSAILFVLINIFIWSLILIFFYNDISGIFKLDKFSILLILLYSGGMAILSCYNSYISLEYKYKSFLRISFFNAISNVAISLLLMVTFLHNNRYLARIIGSTIPVVILSIYICYIFFKRQAPFLKNIDLVWGLKYSLPIIPHGISQVILTQFDRIMIMHMIGSTTSGIYSFAYNIYSIIAVTSSSLDNVWNPWVYEKLHNKEYNLIRHYSTIYAVFMLIFSISVILLSPELISILGGEKYREAVYSVIPIIASGFFSFLYTLPASIEYYNEKTNYIAIGTVIAAVINIILNFFCIQEFGYISAAFTTLLTYILYFIVHYLISIKLHGSCLFNTKIILVMCLILFATSFLTYCTISNIIARISLLMGCVFFSVVIFFKNDDVRKIIKHYKK